LTSEPSFKDVLDAIANAEAKAPALDRAIQAHQDITSNAARWRLARYVFWLYVGVVGASAIYLLYRGVFTGQDTIPELMDLIKVAVLPVVTFVVGYYYGTSSK
jgi:hypothetical protein